MASEGAPSAHGGTSCPESGAEGAVANESQEGGDSERHVRRRSHHPGSEQYYCLNSHGVSGISANQSGVFGYAPVGYGVMGFSNGTASGVFGDSTNRPACMGKAPTLTA